MCNDFCADLSDLSEPLKNAPTFASAENGLLCMIFCENPGTNLGDKNHETDFPCIPFIHVCFMELSV